MTCVVCIKSQKPIVRKSKMNMLWSRLMWFLYFKIMEKKKNINCLSVHSYSCDKYLENMMNKEQNVFFTKRAGIVNILQIVFR